MNRRSFALVAFASTVWLAGCTGATQNGSAGLSAPGRSAGVLEVAGENGSTAFLRAVEAAGLQGELSGDGPYTLFVPTDAAFRAAGLTTGSDRKSLRRVVGYHVVPGQVGTSFMRGMEMNHITAAGDTISIDGRAETIRIDGARLLRQDLQARNGMVHVVDRLLGGG